MRFAVFETDAPQQSTTEIAAADGAPSLSCPIVDASKTVRSCAEIAARMKAVVLQANAVIEYCDVAAPPLRNGECRVAIRAAGVCSSDVPRAFAGESHRYPLIMGHELAGEVIERAADVTEFAPGDRVIVFPLLPCRQCDACLEEQYVRCRSYDYYGSRRDGGFAELLSVPTWNLFKAPARTTLEDAALTEPVAVVYHALARGNAFDRPAGTRVAVLGAGFLGLVAVDLLQRLSPGARVTLIDRNSYKLRIGEQHGATVVSVAGDGGWPACLESHRASFDLVIEASGSPQTFVAATELARAGGTVVWMGNVSGDVTFPQRLTSAILRKELSIVGTWNSSYRGAASSEWMRVGELLASGFRPSQYVSHRIALPELPTYLRRMNDHRSGVTRHEILKVLVTFGHSEAGAAA
jgi:L-iditol 2-dehydrogenase